MKTKLKRLWKWLKKEVLNKEMIHYVIIAELIFWSPAIIFAILALLIKPWFWSLFGSYIAFWAGPFTPGIPIQLGLAVGLKKLVKRIKFKKNILK